VLFCPKCIRIVAGSEIFRDKGEYDKENGIIMAAFFGANEIWERRAEDGRETVILVGVRETNAEDPVKEEEFRHSLSDNPLTNSCIALDSLSSLLLSFMTLTRAWYISSLFFPARRSESDMSCPALFNLSLGVGFP
jgi:hypothetical protein